MAKPNQSGTPQPEPKQHIDLRSIAQPMVAASVDLTAPRPIGHQTVAWVEEDGLHIYVPLDATAKHRAIREPQFETKKDAAGKVTRTPMMGADGKPKMRATVARVGNKFGGETMVIGADTYSLNFNLALKA